MTRPTAEDYVVNMSLCLRMRITEVVLLAFQSTVLVIMTDSSPLAASGFVGFVTARSSCG